MAVQLYLKTLEMNPHDAGVLNNLGAALLHSSRAQEGVIYLQRALVIAPHQPNAYVNLGTYYMEEGTIYPLVKIRLAND
jgi:Tfp pilus assembly protein PilF